MGRKFNFSLYEHYHCYSRGVDKRVVFMDGQDIRRFRDLLYLVNNISPLRWGDIDTRPHKVFETKREDNLVSVIAYCLMPNHYHLVLKEIRKNGLSEFMQKLGIAYTTYFNSKYDRVGNLFVKPFRAKHVREDGYLQHLINYVHLNPAEIFEPGWKEGRVLDRELLKQELLSYEYSSLPDYQGTERSARAILHDSAFEVARTSTLDQIIADASEYYEEMSRFAGES